MGYRLTGIFALVGLFLQGIFIYIQPNGWNSYLYLV